MRFFVGMIVSVALLGPAAFSQKSNTDVAHLQGEPLCLSQTITLPATIKGNFDHFGVDLKRNRLFATPEGSKAVLVFDLAQGKLIP